MKPPFDPVKAAFYLVAAVICTHLILVIFSVVMCALYADTLIAEGRKCPASASVMEVLGAALAAALAFAGGKGKGD